MGEPVDHGPRKFDGELNSARAISDTDVLAQFEQILSSKEFSSSTRLQEFLRYIVTNALAGRSDDLKEYSIAVDVFGRDESFDPQTSSIVRVEASRLRGKLEKYNAIDGRDDPIRIELPIGTYVPTFSAVAARAKFENLDDVDGVVGIKERRLLHRIPTYAYLVPIISAVSILVVTAGIYIWPRIAPTFERPTSISRELSVAVLPLRNFSSDPAEDYFSQGMTDALITRLAQERVASVTSMTSIMAFKDSNQQIAEIGEQLGASHLIEGSVMRVGDKVRISVQLIEAETDRHLWAESYERGMSDILRLQDDVVERIVSSIALEIASGTARSTSIAPIVDPSAYEAYLKGRFFLNTMTEDGFRKGISFFKQSIEKQPNYSPSHSGLAVCYCLLGGHGFELVKPSEGMSTAKKAIMEALRLDSTRAEPHAFLGIIQLKYDWDWPSAKSSLERAIEVNPSYSQAHIYYSYYHEAMGNQIAAVQEAEVAKSLDPLSRAANINLGWQYLQSGNFEKARTTFDQILEIYPEHWGVHWGIGQFHLRQNEYSEAISAFLKARDAGGGHAMPISALGYAYAKTGRDVEAREALAELTALRNESYVSPYQLAVIHSALGEFDQAFVLLEEAYDLRSRSMAWLNAAPELDSLRSDPRYDDLLRRVGLTR